MLFNSQKRTTKLADSICVKKQCQLCPLRKEKGCEPKVYEADVLFLMDKTDYQPIQTVCGHETYVSFMVECGVIGSEPPTVAKSCCLGRKLDLIEKVKPKLVVCAGYEPFKEIETACKNFPDGRCEDFFYPTRYKDQEFWLLQIPEWEINSHLYDLEDQIREAVNNPPVVLQGNYDGVELVCTTDGIDPAFDWLEKQAYVGYDIETQDLHPYESDESCILTIALGTEERTYVFPLFHPQTPSNFDIEKLIRRWRRLTQPRIIAHNDPFEMEWTVHLFDSLGLDGQQWLYEVQWEDTQAQAYVINMPNKFSKSLNNCIRRAFGFDLKSMSNVDVTKLRETPLEQVMLYNSLDAKYTHKLFFVQRSEVEALQLILNYQRQIMEARSAVIMQLTGLVPNHSFIAQEVAKWKPPREAALREWYQYSQVKACIAKHEKCEPSSDKDLKFLFQEEFHVPIEVDSFNDKFLSKFKHQISKTLKEFRSCDKMLSTYLLPYALGEEDGGKYIRKDGLIHPQFNTMLTDTGRWSSNSPNGQNYPSRGGKKYLRNVIAAPDGWVILACDLAQIEYRVAASLTNDPVMLDGLYNDFDVHMYWAMRVLHYFPHLLKNHHDKKALKEFRSAMKSAVVFALIYGAGAKRVAESLEVENLHKIYQLIDEFWNKHGAIKNWQGERRREHDIQLYIENALGRKYFAPLTHNQICNFPIQGTASDMLIEALGKLVYKQVMEDAPWRVILNIHDDISVIVPKNKVDDALCEIVPTMLHTESYKNWLKVPLGVEASVGTTWGAMEKIGDFFSHEIG